MKRRLCVLIMGFALDAVLGDPHAWPHPVRLIGRCIAAGERVVRTSLLPALKGAESAGILAHEQVERLGGMAITASVALSAPLAAKAAITLAGRVHPALALGMETVLCYQLLAARSLYDESMAVHACLARGDLPAARQAVAMIVGRDTDALDERGVVRATVETVAENTSDGVVAPLLFMGVGGAPAAAFYKAVNTLDSMLGYRNDRYLHLGWASARLDDAVNFVPARIAGALMCVAAAVSGGDTVRAWRTFKRDRLKHSSPNAAHTEAACAGALGVQLGGSSRYFGKCVDKPSIGEDTRPLVLEDIPRANRLMYATGVLSLGFAVAIALLLGRRGS